MSIPIQKLEQARMVFNYATKSYKEPITADVDNDVCLGCHKRIAHGVQIRFRTMMSHSEVIKAKILCTDCHEEVAHTKRSPKKTTSIMEKCSGCHNDEQASSRCETCHMNKVWLGMEPAKNWGIVHGKNWLKIHGSRSLYICKACHYDKDCTKCHMAMPHPAGWPNIHGQEARNKRNDCNLCHKEESYCRSCHLTPMPHPDGWLAIHRSEVDIAGKKLCMTCHSSNDCKTCHEKHVNATKHMRKTTQ